MSGRDGFEQDLERDLEQLLREDPAPGRLTALDVRVERLIAAGAPTGTGRWRRTWGATGTVGATLVVAAVAAIVLAGRPGGAPAATPALPSVVVPAEGIASTLESPSPVPEPAAESPTPPSPTPEPTPEPIPEPTGKPTPDPTDKPTAKPTSEPTSKPTREPQPGGEEEPTPRTYVGSGSLGSPLTVHGATLLMSRTDIPTDIGDVCASKGWETWAYDVRMTWKNPDGDVEPYIVVGEHEYHVIWWETRWKVNTAQIAVVCHKPGDSARVRAETTPNGVPLTSYVWKLAP